MSDETERRFAAAEMQQWMADEALRSLSERVDTNEREVDEVLAENKALREALDKALNLGEAAAREIERLRALLPPGVE